MPIERKHAKQGTMETARPAVVEKQKRAPIVMKQVFFNMKNLKSKEEVVNGSRQ